MRRSILALPLAAAILAMPAPAFAQACVGIPAAESQNALTAGVGFPQDAMSFGLSVRRNMAGPFSVSASYAMTSYDNVDPKQHGLAAEASYELPGLSFSACPTVGVGYTRLSQDGDGFSAFSIPVGFGFGSRVELSPTLSLIPYVVPQWVWTRVTVDVLGEEISDSDSALAALFGATFATSRFYFGGGLVWTDQDNVDPVFSIMAGVPF